MKFICEKAAKLTTADIAFQINAIWANEDWRKIVTNCWLPHKLTNIRAGISIIKIFPVHFRERRCFARFKIICKSRLRSSELLSVQALHVDKWFAVLTDVPLSWKIFYGNFAKASSAFTTRWLTLQFANVLEENAEELFRIFWNNGSLKIHKK